SARRGVLSQSVRREPAQIRGEVGARVGTASRARPTGRTGAGNFRQMMRPQLRRSRATGSFAMLEPRLATAAAIAVRVGRFMLTPWRERQVRTRISSDPTLLAYRCNLCNRINAAQRAVM